MKQLLLTFAVIALTASFSHAGKVVYDYDPLGQLESVRNNADKNIFSGSISTGVSNKRSWRLVAKGRSDLFIEGESFVFFD